MIQKIQSLYSSNMRRETPEDTTHKRKNSQRIGLATMADSVYFGDMMRTLHKILDELKLMNKKLDKLIGEK